MESNDGTAGKKRCENISATYLDVLAKRVGIIGIFSDWPSTTGYYASCMEM